MSDVLAFCSHCGSQTVKRSKENITSIRNVGETIIEFKVRDVPVGRCSEPDCEAMSFDREFYEAVEREFRCVVAEIIRRFK